MKNKKLLLSLSLFGAVAIVAGVLAGTNFRNNLKTSAEESSYVINFDRNFALTTAEKGKVPSTFNYTTANGNQIGFASSWWAVTPDNFGGCFENGGHYDAKLYNTTAITGIKSIGVHYVYLDWYTPGTKFVVETASNASFTENLTSYDCLRDAGEKRYSGEYFEIQTVDAPSYFRICPDNPGATTEAYIYSLNVKYSCEAPSNKMVHKVNRIGNKCTATGMDNTGWSNFDASYKFFGVYDDTAIVSANLDYIDHDNRAYHGLMISDGSKLDASKGAETQRNYKAFQLGLAKKGFYSCCDLCGNRGRDASNPVYYPETTVGASGKMTIVLKNNTIYLYINDNYINSKSITAGDPVGGFAAGSKLMFGVWFHNYYNANRSVTMVDEIYGATAVNEEIATNDTYANLR